MRFNRHGGRFSGLQDLRLVRYKGGRRVCQSVACS